MRDQAGEEHTKKQWPGQEINHNEGIDIGAQFAARFGLFDHRGKLLKARNNDAGVERLEYLRVGLQLADHAEYQVLKKRRALPLEGTAEHCHQVIAQVARTDDGDLSLQAADRVNHQVRLRLLLARVNVERAQQGKPQLSLRRLSEESGVSLSVLAALNTGRSQRIDYSTIDHLLRYFNSYFTVTTSDLLTWEQAHERDPLVIMHSEQSKAGNA